MPKPQSTGPSESAVDIRRGNLTMVFLGALMLDLILINVGGALPWRGLSYEWTNRIGIFLGLILDFGFSAVAMIATLRRWDAPRFTAWMLRFVAVLLPLFFIFKLWGRILDAFWLR